MSEAPTSSCPWSTDLDRFLAFVVASRLLDAAGLVAALGGFPLREDSNSDVARLCEHLISQKVLTKWQCGMLQKGQYKGFFLDQFKLLDYVGRSGSRQAYLAEEYDTGRRVTLLVLRNSEMPEGFEYTVVDGEKLE